MRELKSIHKRLGAVTEMAKSAQQNGCFLFICSAATWIEQCRDGKSKIPSLEFSGSRTRQGAMIKVAICTANATNSNCLFGPVKIA